MKKWIYALISLALVVNAVVALLFIPFPGALFQGLWGIFGVWLGYKALVLFQHQGTRKEENNASK